MMNNNYFAGDSAAHWFFNGDSLADTKRAYVLAMSSGCTKLAVFKLPSNAGPWDRFAIVGHRLRARILKDLTLVKGEKNIEFFQEELRALDRVYTMAGRDKDAVAA